MKKLAAMVVTVVILACASVIANAETTGSYTTKTVVAIDALNPINGGFSWNNEAPSDPFGNDYSDACNYFVFHGNYHDNAYTTYSEYKTDGEYDVLSMDISPFSDFGENAESFVQVYADNTLVYTSPLLSRKSGKIHADINVRKANYLKIVIRKGGYGCVMLSDVKLGKADDELALYEDIAEYQRVQQTVSLSTLNPINGGFEWDHQFPTDLYQNDYTKAANYVIYHGNYCDNAYSTYAEYKIDQMYSDFECVIAPYSDFGADASSYVQIYVDDVIRYTSPLVKSKGGVYRVHVDLRGADYMSIVINKGSYGCVMISDCNLTLNSLQEAATPDDFTYLSELDAFNGGFDWNNRFPENLMGDDYSLSNNYYIYHGNYCDNSYMESAEFYLNGKYNTFSFNVAAYSDFGSDRNSVVSVYADDELIYTATVTQKNGMIRSGDLNIAGTAYLKIVIEKDSYGCLILSDAKLK